jgi:uncharacterized membrane protein YgcG
MKKAFLYLFAMLWFLAADAQDFTVKKYSVEIHINEKGYFDVVENYDINFETYKHGIYRTILTNYDLIDSAGNPTKRRIRIDKIKVPNYKFEAPFDFVQKLSDKIEIKIGDKDITLIGPQHYEIKYRVYNAFLFEKDQIRFYWNLKPDGWQANFHQIDFKVFAPDQAQLGAENCFVYSGVRGNTSLTNEIDVNLRNGVLEGKSRDDFISRPGESVTVLINLPPQSIKEFKPFWPFWDKYGWFFLVGALFAGFYMVWQKYGKDDRVVRTTSYYPPENLDPAMAGFLIDDKADHSDLISLLPHWGYQGHLRIEEIAKKGLFGKKDSKLIRLGPLPDTAPDYAKKIFDGLFGSGTNTPNAEVLVSSLKDTFYTTMASARSILKDKAQPYYEAESKKVQTITLVILIVSAILFSLAGLFFWGILACIAILLSCLILLGFNAYMVKKNSTGNRILSELKGFKQFIKVAEENRLKMLLKYDPSYFENTMGYALAFGMFEKWAKKFNALNVPPPQWYSSTTGNMLGMQQFSKSFSGAMASTRANMVSTPSSSGGSSGGGSSGGGFGGGGGGSW